MTAERPATVPAQPPSLFDVFNEIGIIEHLSRTRLERMLPDGLRLSHFSVLNHLVRVGEGTNPVRLARAFQVAKGAMTNTIQRLEERRLIEVRADERDGRAKRIYLTAEGRAMRWRCIAVAEDSLRDVAQDALGSRLMTILPVLTELRKYLDAARQAELADPVEPEAA